MRIDFGLVLGIMLEYIYFIHYADTMFCRKRNKVECYLIIGAVYISHMIICMYGNVVVNTIMFGVINFIAFILCYHVNYKNAAFQSSLLSVLSTGCEWLIIFVPYFQIGPDDALVISADQSMILTTTSKGLYLISIMIVTRIFYKNKVSDDMSFGALTFIPAFTIVIIILMLQMNVNSGRLSLICLFLMIVNLIVFVLNQKMINKEAENFTLKDQMSKEKIDFTEYAILKEKQDLSRIFIHDFKEHMKALNALIQDDNEKAKSYIKTIYNEGNNAHFIEYTNNKILNILLNKKKEECEERNINFSVDPVSTDLEFIKDTDIVPIFSNLINNAIEGCELSEEKNIYLTIHKENSDFIVITLENSSDIKPIIVDGVLKTHKRDEKLHGIGMSSIRKTLKKYNGLLNWTYNSSERVFCAKIVIQLP